MTIQSYDVWFLRYGAWRIDFFVIFDNLLKIYWQIIKIHDHMLYFSWDMARDGCKCYFSFWVIFCPFTPLTAWKIKISKKMKKTPGDIIILHNYIKNHDHMLYCSWDMAHDGCNYFSFWAIFCPFTLLTAQKIKIKKNKKNAWRYHHFTHMNQKLWLDDVRFLRYGAQRTDGWMDGKSDT